MIKRVRDDGQVSREEYEKSQLQFDRVQQASSFARADPSVLATRRILAVQKRGRNEEFVRHIKALNSSLLNFFHDSIKENPSADLTAAVQDYIDFANQLENRYLKSYGEVLTFGSGDCGQLAHGSEDDNLTVKYPRVVYSLRDKKVTSIACGGLHNAIVTEAGLVYTWGCNDDGSLGRPGEEGEPLLVETLANDSIIGVSCGDGQTLALSVTGEVWGWGCYKDKEGTKWFNPDPSAIVPFKDICYRQVNTPIKIAGLAEIVEVICGSAHNVARSASGSVFSWGIGECGELGRDALQLKEGKAADPKNFLQHVYEQHLKPNPMYIKQPASESSNTLAAAVPITNAKAIGVGAYHSLVVTLGNRVYSCGLNNYSQLGHNHSDSCSVLTEITSLAGLGVIQLCGGVHHSLVLTSSGTMLAFGRSDYCQLGVPSNKSSKAGDCSMEPVMPVVPSGTRFIQIACGGNHNLAVTDSNQVYSWGYGDMLALGHGQEQDEPTPKILEFSKGKISQITVTQVAGGGQHSAIIGRVLST